MSKNKLELNWIGKEKRQRLEPRILLEEISKSYHSNHRVCSQDIFENRLIYGDNLLALKSLEQEFTAKIKCVYIDPPFNTQQAMEHYDDGVEHSIWLSLMRDRLELLHRLLANDGTLFVHIDDNELGYLIVLLDEIFGRTNRLYVVTFKQGSATGHKSINPGCVNTTNYIVIYSKNKSEWKPNRIYTDRERDTRYNQYVINIEDNYEQWKITTLAEAFAANRGISVKNARKLIRSEPDQLDNFVIQNAKSVIRFARPDYEGVSAEAKKLIDKSNANPNQIYKLSRQQVADIYLLAGERFLFYSEKLKMIDGRWIAGEPLTTLWDDILSNNLHNEGGIEFPKGKKPEGLIKRVLELVTNPGDWILDSFAGSGTTGAVAHKMKRKWIMVELGDHCYTHIIPRIKKVIDGDDDSGITQAVGWKGGGGFRCFRLAPSLLEKDQFGNWIISKKFNAAMLAEAICRLEGFTYNPSETIYWIHGNSTEKDFIYVTTQTITMEQAQKLSDEVGENRSLLIMCGAFRIKNIDEFSNLTIKKIPKAVLSRCEWGKDDYSLEIKALSIKHEEETSIGYSTSEKPFTKIDRQTTLFDLMVEKDKK
jgi:adenine-specific DNA-methyltransferase